MDAASETTTSEAIKSNVEEIQRRRDVVAMTPPRMEAPPSSRFERSTASAPRDFVLDDQNVLLYSVAARGFAPRPADGHARVRLYGAFADVEEATAHAATVEQAASGTSLLLAPMREWIAVVATEERATDVEYKRDLQTRLLDAYARSRQVDDAEFRAPRPEEAPTTLHTRASDDDDDDDDDDTKGKGGGVGAPSAETAPPPPPPEGTSVAARRTLPATARVAGQRLAVLSIVADPDGDADGNDDECLMRVLGFFDDQTECDAWVRNVASERVQDVHLDVTSSCVWICPRTMRRSADAPKECHRNNELHDIVEYHRSEPERVSEFNKHMSSTGGGRDGEGGGASSDYVRLVEEKAAPPTEAV